MSKEPLENKGAEGKSKRGPHRFQKGQSGNPGGRPKELKEVIALAREHTTTAIEALANIAQGGESDAARVSAANSLLDRAWGKPKDTVAFENGGDGKPFQIVIRKLGDG